VIIHMETGGGKTLIAALLIDHYLEKDPEQFCAFIVPKKALVRQQATELRDRCVHTARHKVVEISGDDCRNWSIERWMFLRDRVIVGTDGIFLEALIEEKLEANKFSLFVFDECHNVTGNSPMRRILDEFVNLQEPSPRVLGLTASFCNGVINNAEKARVKLETTMRAVIKPIWWEKPKGKKFDVYWDKYSVSAAQKRGFMKTIDDLFQPLLNMVSRSVAHSKTLRTIMKNAVMIRCELGIQACQYYISDGIYPQLKQTAHKLVGHGIHKKDSYPAFRLGQQMLKWLPKFREDLVRIADHLKQPGTEHWKDSNKVNRLVSLLEDQFMSAEGLEGFDSEVRGFCGIVFVKEICKTYPLACILSKRLLSLGVKVKPVSGVNAMSERDRAENIELFRKGDVRILVATASLEEGINVPHCSFVVRFDKFDTTKSYIQGSGRVRHPNASIYHFHNRVEDEERKRQYLEEIAGRPAVPTIEITADRQELLVIDSSMTTAESTPSITLTAESTPSIVLSAEEIPTISTDGKPPPININWKSALKEILDKKHRGTHAPTYTSTNIRITEDNKNEWQAEVFIQDYTPEPIKGDICLKRKEAEKDAAKKALMQCFPDHDVFNMEN